MGAKGIEQRTEEELKQLTINVIDDIGNNHLGISDSLIKNNLLHMTFSAYLKKYPELEERYSHARKRYADFLANQVIHISDNETNPHKARVRMDARRWLASKLNASVYGDKLDISIETKVDISGALDAAKKRAALVASASVVLDQSLKVDGLESPASEQDSELDDMLR